MLSRALILAAVILLVGCLGKTSATAQNLEAGKPPAQIFSNTCSICHKSSRGLLQTVTPGSLPEFLRQHYTTSTDMAAVMSGYLLSNGAALARTGGDNLTLQGRDAKTGTGGKPSVAPEQGGPSAVTSAEPGAKQKSAKESGKDSGKSKSARPEPSTPEPANNNEAKEAKPESMPDTGTETAKAEPPNVSEKDSETPDTPKDSLAKEAAATPDHSLTIDMGPLPAPAAVREEPPLPPAGPPIPPISH